ncbi:MAG: hypothetical protein ACKOEM_21365 [Planctomycetia bacterium]
MMVEEGAADELTGCKTVTMKHVKSRNHRQRDIRLEFDGAIQRFRLLPERAEGQASAEQVYAEVVSPEEMRRETARRLTLHAPIDTDASFLDPDAGDEGSEG